jgi:hypothetical protein
MLILWVLIVHLLTKGALSEPVESSYSAPRARKPLGDGSSDESTPRLKAAVRPAELRKRDDGLESVDQLELAYFDGESLISKRLNTHVTI